MPKTVNLQQSEDQNAASTISPENGKSWLDFFCASEWVFFAGLLIVGLLLRWLDLDQKPMHHDESMHGMYGRYFYDWPDIQYQKYDPMLHGPLLYTTYRLIYATFGLGDWSVRTAVAIPGSLLLLIPLLFRRYFSPAMVLTLTAFTCLSPTLIYWCKLIHHDLHVLLGMAIMLYGFSLARAPLKSFFVFLGIVIQWATKENIFVTLALLVGFVVYEPIFNLLVHYWKQAAEKLIRHLRTFWLLHAVCIFFAFNLLVMFTPLRFLSLVYWTSRFITTPLFKYAEMKDGFFAAAVLLILVWTLITWAFIAFACKEEELQEYPILLHIKRYRAQVFVSALFAMLVFAYLFTAGFRYQDEYYFKGIFDGLGRGSFAYWIEQHKIERIKGEFLYHFYFHGWYELPFTLIFLMHMLHIYKRGGISTRFFAGLSWLIGIIFGLIRYWNKESIPIDTVSIWKFFNLKDSFDIVALFVLSMHAVIVTSFHLYRREKTLAFWGYFFTATFFAYSYVGEKVPWLGVYPFVTGLVYLALYFDDYYKKNPIDYKNFSWERTFYWFGIVCLALYVWFTCEMSEYQRLRMPATILTLVLMAVAILCHILNILRNYVFSVALIIIGGSLLIGSYELNIPINLNNSGFLLSGAILSSFAFFGSRFDMLSSYNLKVALLALFCVYNLRQSIMTNFIFAGEGLEFIGQVHTTKEFHEVAMRLKNEITSESKGYRPWVLAEGEPVWPITWYLRDLPEYKFSAPQNEWKNFTYILKDYKVEDAGEQSPPEAPPPGFISRKLRLRGWWVPDVNEMTLKRFLNYSLNRQPWNPPGYSYCTMLTNLNPPIPGVNK